MPRQLRKACSGTSRLFKTAAMSRSVSAPIFPAQVRKRLRAPLGHKAVVRRHVLVARCVAVQGAVTLMGGDALVVVRDLYAALVIDHLDALSAIGPRHAVEMLVLTQVDVVVELDGRLTEAAHLVGGGRKRPQHRCLDLEKTLAA